MDVLTAVVEKANAVYYHLTLPARYMRHRQAVLDGSCPIVVVFYHRISERSQSPWTTSPDFFREQINWLSDNFEIISISEAIGRLKSGWNDSLAACITFDDGYADNFDFAIPLLFEKRIPFSYFVTLENVLEQKPFEHDLAAGCVGPPNTPEQIRWLAQNGVEVGSHCWTHADLSRCFDPNQLEWQVIDSKHALEDLIGAPVEFIAVPFGTHHQLHAGVLEAVFAAGYRAFLSAYGGYNLPGEFSFHLRRLHGDNNIWTFRRRLFYDGRQLRLSGSKQERQFEQQIATSWSRVKRSLASTFRPNVATST